MELKFDYAEVEKYFSDIELMKEKIGKNLARGIKKRCDQLQAASNFSDFLITGLGKPHSLTGNLRGGYGISVSGNIRLVVIPEAESLDPGCLKKCDTVIVKGVVDYHGQKHEWLIP